MIPRKRNGEVKSALPLGVHIRAGDDVRGKEMSDKSCEGLDPKWVATARVGCIVDLAKEHLTAKKRVLVVFSDSACVKMHVMRYFSDSELFTEVWTQELSGSVNIDTTQAKLDQEHAWKQTMRDWTIMRLVNMFAITSSYDFLSGFPASALVSSNVHRRVYDLKTCKPMHEMALCAKRFC